jgi:hypothetical protein
MMESFFSDLKMCIRMLILAPQKKPIDHPQRLQAHGLEGSSLLTFQLTRFLYG